MSLHVTFWGTLGYTRLWGLLSTLPTLLTRTMSWISVHLPAFLRVPSGCLSCWPWLTLRNLALPQTVYLLRAPLCLRTPPLSVGLCSFLCPHSTSILLHAVELPICMIFLLVSALVTTPARCTISDFELIHGPGHHVLTLDADWKWTGCLSITDSVVFAI